MKIGKPLAMLVAFVCCAACEYRAHNARPHLAYNRAVASSTNQVLLLNVVRASERLPTYYTRLEGDAASMALTPSSSLSLPLDNPHSFETDTNLRPDRSYHQRHHQSDWLARQIGSGLGLPASRVQSDDIADIGRPEISERHDDTGSAEEYSGLPG